MICEIRLICIVDEFSSALFSTCRDPVLLFLSAVPRAKRPSQSIGAAGLDVLLRRNSLFTFRHAPFQVFVFSHADTAANIAGMYASW